MFSHNSATAAAPALSASHAGDHFPYVDPAATHSTYQQSSSDLAEISGLEDLEANPQEDRVNVPEPRQQILANGTRSGPLPDISSTTDFNGLPFDQGIKTFKKPGSPRKLYSLFSTARLQQHRQKFFSKHLNGVHFLNYPQSESSDDLLHSSDTGIRCLGNSLTPPRTLSRGSTLDIRNSSIMESTRKLKALGL